MSPNSLSSKFITISVGLEGQDDNFDRIQRFWENLQISAYEPAAEPECDIFSFAQTAVFFGIVHKTTVPETTNIEDDAHKKVDEWRKVTNILSSSSSASKNNYKPVSPSKLRGSAIDAEAIVGQASSSPHNEDSVNNAKMPDGLTIDSDDDWWNSHFPAAILPAMKRTYNTYQQHRKLGEQGRLEYSSTDAEPLPVDSTTTPNQFKLDNDQSDEEQLTQSRLQAEPTIEPQHTPSRLEQLLDGWEQRLPRTSTAQSQTISSLPAPRDSPQVRSEPERFPRVNAHTLAYQRPEYPPHQYSPPSSGDIIGLVYLTGSPFVMGPPGATQIPEVNVGVFIDEPYRRKGYARETIKLVLANAFENLKVHRVQATLIGHVTRNHMSSILTQLFFTHEGTARAAFYHPFVQEWQDMTRFGILDTDWSMRQLWKPAPKSMWDELFTRHERERDELLRWEEKTGRVKRSASLETLRAPPPDSVFDLTMSESDLAAKSWKGKEKAKTSDNEAETDYEGPIQSARLRGQSEQGYLSDADSAASFDQTEMGTVFDMAGSARLARVSTSSSSSDSFSDIESEASMPESVVSTSGVSWSSDSWDDIMWDDDNIPEEWE
ncbi:Spermidine n1-acetyltransferase [Mycena indigotica]|uniref:Spermidine n1-acetyltransferase n=1 Tax=Mycena indigotica TaxID=2126181 RepID=A0A8H6VQE0_9AGAR|nr:Spermidine n1-acetyltransferase [Mycena indigotica]KAF7289874.1 Spermidine n1-acetyltransferase [Mycena indigotica]